MPRHHAVALTSGIRPVLLAYLRDQGDWVPIGKLVLRLRESGLFSDEKATTLYARRRRHKPDSYRAESLQERVHAGWRFAIIDVFEHFFPSASRPEHRLIEKRGRGIHNLEFKALPVDPAPPEPGVEPVLIEQIVVGDRVRRDDGDITALAESIDTVGMLLHPIILDGNYRLVSGGRRLKACQSLGWKAIPARICPTFDQQCLAYRAEQDENTQRKDFTPPEFVEMGRRLEGAEKEKAAARKRRGRPRKGEISSGNLPDDTSSGQTRDKVAETLGVSATTYEHAKAVVDAAKDEPEAYGDLVQEMHTTGKVDPAYKKLKHRKGETSAQPRSALPGIRKKLPSLTPEDRLALFEDLLGLLTQTERSSHVQWLRHNGWLDDKESP